jgi:amino acid permease
MQASGPWALGVILIAVIAIAAFTIVIFHKRVLQMRLTIFTMLLLIGYILAYVFYAWVYQQKLNEIQAAFQPEFQLRLNTVYPLVSVILCFLAFRGIRRDEKLIRSLERIR